MNNTFHLIDRTKWERDIYFDYYYNRIKCRYTLNANIDITELAAYQASWFEILSYDALCDYEGCECE